MKNLELSDVEAVVLSRKLSDITCGDHYPLRLEEILGMLRWRALRRPGFNRVLSRGGSRLLLVLAVLRADRPTCRSAGCAVGWVGERDRVKQSILALALSLTLLAEATGAYGQTKGPIAIPVPTIYSRPTPAPAGTAGQSRPGGCATRWALSPADGTGAGIPAPSTSDAGLPVPPAPRPGGTAEYEGLPEQPTRPAMAARAERYQSRQRA